MNYVEIDHAHAVRVIIDHLIERGHRRMGLLLFSSGHQAMAARLGGYKLGLQRHIIPYDENLVYYLGMPAIADIDTLRPYVLRAVKEDHVDALIASNDWIAAREIRILEDGGYKVPEDMAVTGYDNLGLNDAPARSTLSYANEHRPWQLFDKTFYQVLEESTALAATHQRRFRFKNPLRSLDASTMDLCIKVHADRLDRMSTLKFT